MDAISIVAIITSIGSMLVILGKTIKKSTCLGCFNCESRTPPPSIITPLPTPVNSPQIKKKETFDNNYIVEEHNV